MPTSKTTTYANSLYCDALIRALNGATSLIEIAMFLMRTDYVGETSSKRVCEAVKAAALRGVKVLVILNYSRFETDVAELNHATAMELAAAGCIVRMGPPNRTVHAKVVIIDLALVFVGSHNITRGGLDFNFELTIASRTRYLVTRVCDFFNELWYLCTPLGEVPPPTAWTAVRIGIGNVTPDGAALKAAFTVNHTEGVDAFAAVVADNGALAGAVMGATVATTEQEASVIPIQQPGTTVYVAVRAYANGQAIATSDRVRLVYDPTETGGGGEGEGGGGGEEPPPPEPLTAPHLDSVVAGLNGTEITVTWTFAGCDNFHRFEIQKRDLELNWHVVGMTMDPAARQWVGPGPGTIEPTPYRVVVFNMAEESAASNEITITGEPPVSLTAPVVVSVTQIGPMGINVEYSHVTPAEFTRYEVQQRANGSWSTLATITTPETRSWSGGPIPYMDTTHPVRMVVFVQSGVSAASNEMVITPM